MSGYPHPQPGHGYAPAQSYGSGGYSTAPPQQPYATAQPYSDPSKPPKEHKPAAAPGGYPPAPGPGYPSGGYPAAAPGGYPTAPPQQPYATAQPYSDPSKPPKEHKPAAAPGGYPSAPGPGYPSAPGGYPAAAPGGYPAAAPGGYTAAAPGGYPAAAPGGYPAAGGYPPAQPGYGSPFASLTPSQFPPGTDPNVVNGFQAADQDRSGFIDDKELQRALSGYNQTFSLRTVHLLMYLFTNSNAKKIGPKEFTSVYYSLQEWRGIFERFDRDRSGKIDVRELNDALQSLGFAVSPTVLELLVSKYDKKGGKDKAIEYDNFIECCLTVKGLTEKFKEKDTMYTGSATFSYEVFMLTVLPFLIA